MKQEKNASFEDAKEKALRVLERRQHTKKELSDKLIRAGFEQNTVYNVCEWASEYGFINDEEYARAFTGDCIKYKNYGKKRIRQTLLYKGVAAYIADAVLEEFDFHEADKLFDLLPKKLNGNFERKNIEKVMRHFAAKGYSFDEIKSAVSRCREEYSAGEDDEFEL